MSQIISFDDGIGPGSDVQTLTGDTGGAVGPTSNNIDILGGPGIIVTGDPGTSTLTVSQTGASEATVNTTDDTPTLLFSVTLSDDDVSFIRARILASVLDVSGAIGGTIDVISRKEGANPAVIVGTPNIYITEDIPGNPTFSVTTSGNDIQFIVTGVVATDITWVGFFTDA